LQRFHIGPVCLSLAGGRQTATRQKRSGPSILCLIAVQVDDQPAHQLVHMVNLRIVQLTECESLLGLGRRQEIAEQSVAAGRDLQHHKAPVVRVAHPAQQATVHKRVGDAGQRGLGDAGADRRLAGLDALGREDFAKHNEPGPTQVFVSQHGLLDVMADRIGRAVQFDKGATDIGARNRPPSSIDAVFAAYLGHHITLRR
jgi:hypothetical protein